MRDINKKTVLLETDEEAERAKQLVRQQPPSQDTHFPTSNPKVVPQLRKEFPSH